MSFVAYSADSAGMCAVISHVKKKWKQTNQSASQPFSVHHAACTQIQTATKFHGIEVK